MAEKAGWIFLLRKSNLPLAYRPFPAARIGRYDAKFLKNELANEFFFTFLTKENSKKERDKYLHQPFFLKFVGRNVTSPKQD